MLGSEQRPDLSSDGERIPLKVSSIESPDSVIGRFPRQHVDEAEAFVLDDGDVEDGDT